MSLRQILKKKTIFSFQNTDAWMPGFLLFIKILEYEHLHLSLTALLTSMSSDNLSVYLSVAAPATDFTVGPTLS
jgi:hypothetical protein